MATRGVIARLTHALPPQWAGRYHHWNSYPSGLGRTLWHLYHNQFHCDFDALLDVLIDQHPAGWSSIHGADFSLVSGFSELGHRQNDNQSDEQNDNQSDGLAPQCYCHGDRAEEEWLVTQHNAAGSGCEWAYVFAKAVPLASEPEHVRHTLMVFASFRPGGEKMIGFFGRGDSHSHWKPVANIDLNGDEPDWEAIERQWP